MICVNGGSAPDRPGDWSATLEYLVRRLSPAFAQLRFSEVRYRNKSWRRLDLCVADCQSAIEQAVADGAGGCALLGFSMGGAVAVACAGHPAVSQVIGLAPWMPERLDPSGLEGKRLSVIHGTLDLPLPGVAGVSIRGTLRAFERIRARGTVDGVHTPLRFALHGVAVRSPWNGLIPLPRAGAWVERVAAELSRLQAEA